MLKISWMLVVFLMFVIRQTTEGQMTAKSAKICRIKRKFKEERISGLCSDFNYDY